MIGAMLCDGITLPHLMGVGGGFFMVIYNREHKNVSTINARETAPAAATVDMFSSNHTSSQKGLLVFNNTFINLIAIATTYLQKFVSWIMSQDC